MVEQWYLGHFVQSLIYRIQIRSINTGITVVHEKWSGPSQILRCVFFCSMYVDLKPDLVCHSLSFCKDEKTGPQCHLFPQHKVTKIIFVFTLAWY